jgi:uncharacterized zinc-type alcohol dehydrogenase-like protein
LRRRPNSAWDFSVLVTIQQKVRKNMVTKAYGAIASDKKLEPLDIERRRPGPRDVQIEIAYCGVCHSDLHTVRGEWGGTLFPCVPGHEIVGQVTAIGDEVSKYKVGDTVGVGCMVDSCRHCPACEEGLEQYCDKFAFVGTYNGSTKDAPGHTLGGYSQRIVVDEDFVLKIGHPEEQLAAVAPLLCIGGLGHMGIKIAHAMGAHVVAFTTSENKRQDAHDLGADEVINSRNAEEMEKHANSFDFILDTVAASHDLDALTSLLKRDGTLCLVGVPEHPHPSPNVGNLIFRRRAIAGSLIGGIPETQEMLDFCAEHGIVADIEMIRIQQIDEAYDRMQRSDVKYRFVIDSKTLAE